MREKGPSEYRSPLQERKGESSLSSISPFRTLLLILGGVFLVAGVFWPILSRSVGKLPGDIVIRRSGFTFVFPIVTCLLLSLVLTFLLWLFRR